MSEASLKDKAVSGVLWMSLQKFVNQLVTFVIGILLSRLITPEEFGVIGMLSIFFAVAATFQQCGFGTALVQKKDRTDADFSTTFIFNVSASVIVYAVLFFAAPYIADFYETPILTDVTRISALTFIIGGLSGIQYSKLNIDLNFRVLSIMSIISQIITGVIGFTLAFLGFGVWALVLQSLISGVITGVIIWGISDWKPKLIFSTKSFKQLFSYGANMLGSNLINTIYAELYTLVIGKCYNPFSVGMYNRANGFAQMPTQAIMSLSQDVNFPIMVKLQNDNERLLRAYEKLLELPIYILYPTLIGLIVLAEPIVQVLIGDTWLPCVPYIQILCVGYLFYPLNGFNISLLNVKGRPDLVLKMDFIKKPIGILLLISAIPFGIMWMMVGKAAYSVIVFSLNTYYTREILDYGLVKQIAVILPILCKALFMGGTVFMVSYFITSNLTKLIIGIPVGIFVYLGISILFKDTALYEITNILKNKIYHK